MNILFVSGGDQAFFNSLLVCLQSFSERVAGHRLLVCDFGFSPGQAQFLRGLGVLLERPAACAADGVFVCKAALGRYLRQSGHRIEDYAAVVWLDADLTLMEVSERDFGAVIAAMQQDGAAVAACGEPAGGSLAQVAAERGMAPFARALADESLDGSAPYFSSGLIFCRSATLLDDWEQATRRVAAHPVYEQNMFNVAVHRNRLPFVTLECEQWQAQGRSLDGVQLVAGAGARPAARLGDKNINTLHATSPELRHLLIAQCRLTVHGLDLCGPFKLLMAEPLRLHQLQLLSLFVAVHGEALLRLGICTPAAKSAAGFDFTTL